MYNIAGIVFPFPPPLLLQHFPENQYKCALWIFTTEWRSVQSSARCLLGKSTCIREYSILPPFGGRRRVARSSLTIIRYLVPDLSGCGVISIVLRSPQSLCRVWSGWEGEPGCGSAAADSPQRFFCSAMNLQPLLCWRRDPQQGHWIYFWIPLIWDNSELVSSVTCLEWVVGDKWL